MADHRGRRRSVALQQGADEQRGADDLGHDVGDRRPGHAPPGRVDEHRAEHRRHHVGQQHDADRGAGVLHAAQPPVAGDDDQHERQPAHRDPQPELGRGLGRGRATGEDPGERPGERLPDAHADDAQQHREPRRLRALGDGVLDPAGAVPARGPRRRAVLEEAADHGDERQQRARHPDPAERDLAEVTDDGRVDQDVQRLGGEHDERRPGQGEQPAGAGDRGRAHATGASSSRYITTRSTRPARGCRNAPGTRPTAAKPSRS